MESQLTFLFRQLFSHRPCQSSSSKATLRIRRQCGCSAGVRYIGNRSGGEHPMSPESHWRPRSDILPYNMAEEYKKYPMVTADQLRGRKERPRRVKMLIRDFIEDSLYNPTYGYFPKHAVIFTPGEPCDFNSLKNEPEFHRLLVRRYRDFEDRLDEKEPNESRQLWHTPTELFRPYYGEAIARYLVSNYKLSHYPYQDLIVYEMGAGNGTLMLNILDYIRDTDPLVYERTKFKIIEISANLAALQTRHLMQNADSRGHASKVEIINKSIFEWNQVILNPCFFLAMEVFDNFAHDAIRYDPFTEEPMQGTMLIDIKGDFYDFYEPEMDPVCSRYLRIRHAATGGNHPHPLSSNPVLKYLRESVPVKPNLSEPEFIPTRLMQFFDVLAKYFPAHRLVASDFHYLPQTIKGMNAPVVQTRYQRRVVPVTRLLVHQGFFDILFPTNFYVMESVYRAMTCKFTNVLSHEDFLKRWAYVDETRTQSGENPLLSWYKNASVLTTV